ncbi:MULTISPECIES: hypothetical protein [unclassified Rhodococcus (in: high G+C Gram-positive bacteria)]|uniref:hypothetical protein n=1 Tax=unclassified Rhodococcus (in: high G+C Gram-positive bacteria) TaxID=192944 RepID=UPI000B9C3524|nr:MULTISPECIES: hypothetical protein [unclassified Rhodococcus (in: high G+C Gram-positive bacteria)]OZE35603.1 hypothetical protein CH259_16370 [Rhodococcus sp. 05-2254-4]OZE48032.1 hypothetical protein CH261_08965 [Rhodococcus sp. 05-2254-3]OZE49243.1 hypothetical protein CH283_16750 [Rhodococcus sp. 05-2254-2]
MAFEIDLDAIAAKREEEIGSRDKFPFVFKGETWQCLDPLILDDDQKSELQELDNDDLEGYVLFFLGDEQAQKFWEMGGGSAQVANAQRLWVEHNTDESGPTRRTPSSNRMQRRSKRR